jgi:hypothetical protein
LPWQQRLLISYQLASALAALHSSKPRQLLHRWVVAVVVFSFEGACNGSMKVTYNRQCTPV